MAAPCGESGALVSVSLRGRGKEGAFAARKRVGKMAPTPTRRLAMRRLVLLPLALLPLLAAQEAKPPPSPTREFRGVWVATVANIDWPSKKGLTTKQQQAELTAILDKAAKLNFNAV